MSHDIHDRLMTAMAHRAGLDLDAAEMRGDLAPEARADMQVRCRGCADPAGCLMHLGTQGHDLPVFCRNADAIDALTRR